MLQLVPAVLRDRKPIRLQQVAVLVRLLLPPLPAALPPLVRLEDAQARGARRRADVGLEVAAQGRVSLYP